MKFILLYYQIKINIIMSASSVMTKNTSEDAGSKGNIQIFKKREGPRYITIAFKNNKDTGEVTYGGSIYHNTETRDFVVTKKMKRSHNQTAIERLKKRPDKIKISASTVDELRMKIRKALFKHGTKGERR